MQITQTIQRSALVFPDRPAVIYRDRKRTWREVVARVARAAGALKELGLQPGEHVPVLAFNNDRYLELMYAIPWAGGVIVPVNIRWADAEIAEALSEVNPRVIFLDDAFIGLADALRVCIPSLKHIVAIGEELDIGHRHYEKLVKASTPVEDAGRTGNDAFTRFYTGGTTGKPRGVTISHQNAVFASLSYIAELQLTGAMVHMHVGGFFHLSGAGHLWYTSMVGGCHVILPKFEVLPALEAIHTHRVTNTVLLPTMVNMMLQDERAGAYDLSSMRLCIYGGSPMPTALISAFIELLPNWSFIQVYAMTETAGLATFLPWSRHFEGVSGPSKINSVGQAALGVEIRVIDSNGNDAPPGNVGEIAIRGANVMKGYAGPWPSELSASAFGSCYLRSGDLGWLDSDHFLYVVDRAKDMIISGGENVYSAEVENAIYKHPAVRECAVIGVPDPKWGESVLAIIVLKDGMPADESEIVTHCRSLIANFKCPKRVEIRKEALPLSPAGKIKKDLLRAPYWEGLERRIG